MWGSTLFSRHNNSLSGPVDGKHSWHTFQRGCDPQMRSSSLHNHDSNISLVENLKSHSNECMFTSSDQITKKVYRFVQGQGRWELELSWISSGMFHEDSQWGIGLTGWTSSLGHPQMDYQMMVGEKQGLKVKQWEGKRSWVKWKESKSIRRIKRGRGEEWLILENILRLEGEGHLNPIVNRYCIIKH